MSISFTFQGVDTSTNIVVPLIDASSITFFQINSASASYTYDASGLSFTLNDTSTNVVDVSWNGTASLGNGFDGWTNGQYLLKSVNSWSSSGFKNLSYAFSNCTSLTYVPTTLPLIGVNYEMIGMFNNAVNFNSDISGWNTSQVTDMTNMFSAAVSFNSNISEWNTSHVTNMSNMFNNAVNFNSDISRWDTSQVTTMISMFSAAVSFNSNISEWNTSKVVDMVYMFYNATAFNQPIGNWDTNKVTSMAYMFTQATAFNSNISGWNTSKVSDMAYMFSQATAFNQNLASWNITEILYNAGRMMIGMFDDSGLSTDNYNNILNGWASQEVKSNITLDANGIYYSSAGAEARSTLINTYSWTINDAGLEPTPGDVPCFGEKTKILCYDKLLQRETYMSIQSIRKGTLVKTLKHGYVPVDMIGKRVMTNNLKNDDIKNRLYKCSKENFPEIVDKEDDLILTGCHAILLYNFKDNEQIEKTREILGKIFETDDHYRVPICLDERASPYEKEGDFTIYHFALEHEDYYMNYGVYANGLLVETCSKRYMKEESKMTLIE